MTLLNGSSINEILRKKEYKLKEEGIKKGEHNKQTKIANNMIERGFPINQIAEITELNVNSIHQLTLEK